MINTVNIPLKIRTYRNFCTMKHQYFEGTRDAWVNIEHDEVVIDEIFDKDIENIYVIDVDKRI